ncbi:MAG TPA: hypothetical protein VE690_15650 [Rhodopila sp.]|jgi:uncharacterized protein YjiS (DUF1127 family)|nr:hypothetical protein [Rhodopila sp.]
MASAAVHSLTNRQVAVPRPKSHARHPLRALARLFHRWQARNLERRNLELFDQRDLDELRLSRWQIEHELSRHFWEP